MYTFIFFVILILGVLTSSGVLTIKLSRSFGMPRLPKAYYNKLESTVASYTVIPEIDLLLTCGAKHLRDDFSRYKHFKRNGTIYEDVNKYLRIMFDGSTPLYAVTEMWATCFTLAYLDERSSRFSPVEAPIIRDFEKNLKSKYQRLKKDNPSLAAVFFYQYSHVELEEST